MPLGFHPFWLVILLVIVLIIFGPGKLPELGGALGRGIREFRKTQSEITDEIKNAVAGRDPVTPAPVSEPVRATEPNAAGPETKS